VALHDPGGRRFDYFVQPDSASKRCFAFSIDGSLLAVKGSINLTIYNMVARKICISEDIDGGDTEEIRFLQGTKYLACRYHSVVQIYELVLERRIYAMNPGGYDGWINIGVINFLERYQGISEDYRLHFLRGAGSFI
jgi:hypothetical protein